MYMLGLGTAKNEAAGIRLYREAATRGSVEAQRTLASTYLTGRGHPEDDPDAERWLVAAVENRAVGSKYRLGVMYLTAGSGHDRLGGGAVRDRPEVRPG
jgi:TPR repeat protein